GCTELTSVTIPNGVRGIGWDAFSGCTALTIITIGNSLTNIAFGAFRGCTGLTSITVDPLNSAYASLDGPPFDKNNNLLIRYPAAKAQGGYIIPNTVTNIRDFAFEGCKALTSVTIPDSVSYIGLYAFSRCSQLRSTYFEGNEPRTEQNSWASEE